MFSKPRISVASPKTAELIIQKSVSWEESRIYQLEKSESRAWWVARVGSLVALLAVIALALLIPFYTIIPVVFNVDNLTGEVLQVNVGKAAMPPSEVMDKHWLATYVQTRERYVWTLLQTDFDMVMSLTSDSAAGDYRAIYEGKNALDKKLGENTDMRVKIISVELTPGTPGNARVIWERTMRQKGNDVERGKRFVSSISFKYLPNPPLTLEKQLIANPFGFRVDGYDVATVLATGNADNNR